MANSSVELDFDLVFHFFNSLDGLKTLDSLLDGWWLTDPESTRSFVDGEPLRLVPAEILNGLIDHCSSRKVQARAYLEPSVPIIAETPTKDNLV